MTFLSHTLRTGCIPLPFNVYPFFSKSTVSSGKRKSECNFMDAELIEPECKPYEQVLAQWTQVQTVLQEDSWYREQGLSELEEAKFAAVLSNFAKVCAPLMQWAEKEGDVESGMPSSSGGLVAKKENPVSREDSSQIEADLAYLHRVMLRFDRCYQEFKLEPEKPQKGNFLFWFSLTLILTPIVAPVCAQLCTALAISASLAMLFGKCFVFTSVFVQLCRFLESHTEGERRAHLNQHKNVFNQFTVQLEEALRKNMSMNSRIESLKQHMDQQIQGMQRQLAELKAAQQVQPSNNTNHITKEEVEQALFKSGISSEQAQRVLKSIDDLV